MDSVRQAMVDAGFTPPPDLTPNGKLLRFKRDDSQKEKDSWVVCWQWNTRKGEIAYTAIWSDWHESEVHKFISVNPQGDDRAHFEKQVKQAQKKAEQDREKDYALCREHCKEYLPSLQSADPSSNKYLEHKRLNICPGALADGSDLVIPITDRQGAFVGYQTIKPDGQKRFRIHTQKRGNFFRIPGSKDVYLTEGYATGVTVHQATGATVVVCFDAGNVASVRQHFPDAILAGDNDEAGRNAGTGIFPPGEGDDWNDHFQKHGLESIREALTQEPEEEIRPLGFKGSTYYYWSTDNKQVNPLEASSHTENNFLSLQTKAFWDANYGGKYKDAAAQLMSQARRRGIFNPRHVRGSGVWLDPHAVINTGTHVHPKSPRSKYIYISATEIPAPSTESDPNTLHNILANLSWKHPEDASLLLGWLCIAPFCGALAWRPHLWLTGKAGSGKSTVLEQIISPVLGEYKISVKGNSTEAGIRQTLGHNALPVIFDEFELDGDNNQRGSAIMDLFRQASIESSGEIVKGSSGGDSIQYSARFCGLVTSIGINLNNESDKGRFTVIELVPGDRAKFRSIETSFGTLSPEYSVGLFSYTFNRFSQLQANIKSLWDILNQKYGARFAQQYSALLGGYCLWSGTDPTPSFIEQFNFRESVPNETEDADEHRCLNQLLGNSIQEEPGRTRTVSELIDEGANTVLERWGMKLTETDLWVAQSNPMLKRLFQGSKWAGGQWSKALARLPGASNNQKQRIQKKPTSCVRIPLSLFRDSSTE
jgi:putative DNA primase/helicase